MDMHLLKQNIFYTQIYIYRQTMAANADRQAVNNLEGVNRSSVVGNDRGSVFIVGFQHASKAERQARLKKYPPKNLTADDIEEKQKAAADRKKVCKILVTT